jgi:hypothetical protein
VTSDAPAAVSVSPQHVHAHERCFFAVGRDMYEYVAKATQCVRRALGLGGASFVEAVV